MAELERQAPGDDKPDGPESYGLESTQPQTPEEFRAALKALNPNERDIRKARRLAEVELQRRFLELHPDHREAGLYLTDLSNNLIFLDLDEAYAVLDEFKDKVTLPPGEIESKQANILMLAHKSEEGIALYDQLTRDPRLSETEQCEYAFWHAYSVQSSGDTATTVALYHALLDRIGDDVPPSLKNTVGGIHNQLKGIE